MKYNVLIGLFCMFTLSAMDMGYYQFVNPNYVFKFSALAEPGYLATFVIIMAATFAGRFFWWAFISLVFVISIFQLVNFEYFGSYILPINFIQLLPDFWLITSSLFEAGREMLPVLAISVVGLVMLLVVLVPLSRRRIVNKRAALVVLILLGSDFLGNYLFIQTNKEKLGEPSYLTLFPNINRLGIENAYRSARYLTVGILPDRLSGKTPDYPALPAPAILQQPDVNIVIIMNETVRAASLSVLGYELPTTPYLDQLKGAFAASVYSAGTMTRTSWAGFVNRLKYPGIGKQFLSQSNCLFRLAAQNGFKTHFIYAANREVADTLLPFMCSKYIDAIQVSTDAPQGLQEFDRSLAYHIENIDLEQPNFIFIGMSGAHSPYAEKSPAEFKIFQREYDNAIYYSHHVVGELIERLRKSSKPTYVLYTSDHGELLKGEADKRGHGWFNNHVFNVPFIFLPINVAASSKIMANVERVQSHFDMATLAVQLMGYDVAVDRETNKEIFVNGSDLSGLAGSLRLHFQEGKLQEVELINGTGAGPSLEEVVIR